MNRQPSYLRQSTPAGSTSRPDLRRQRLAARYRRVRAATERLMAPLLPDDFRIQSMEDVSPPYWNLGHTTWFFARNVLPHFRCAPAGFDGLRDGLEYALNSYYEGLGPRLPRARRGQVASPSTETVRDYRAAVDAAVQQLIADVDQADLAKLERLIAIGCQHEQQHQELFVTEILHIRWSAPEQLRRGYLEDSRSFATSPSKDPGPLRAVGIDGGDTVLGYRGKHIEHGGFCWDNELPAHRVHVGGFALADRLITNAEWQQFIDDGGYRDPLLWLSNGWDFVQANELSAPLYWQREGREWRRFSHYGLHEPNPHAPVCHVSFYEADAFARWFGANHAEWRHARLPRECEWEHAARERGFDTVEANLLDDDLAHCVFDVEPVGRSDNTQLRQLAGSAWEWTQSHYEPYPGHRPFEGALMEYNSKFMDNQRVLRGGSFATPRSSARIACRNFWGPATRFQATSVRLLRE